MFFNFPLHNYDLTAVVLLIVKTHQSDEVHQSESGTGHSCSLVDAVHPFDQQMATTYAVLKCFHE